MHLLIGGPDIFTKLIFQLSTYFIVGENESFDLIFLMIEVGVPNKALQLGRHFFKVEIEFYWKIKMNCYKYFQTNKYQSASSFKRFKQSQIIYRARFIFFPSNKFQHKEKTTNIHTPIFIITFMMIVIHYL